MADITLLGGSLLPTQLAPQFVGGLIAAESILAGAPVFIDDDGVRNSLASDASGRENCFGINTIDCNLGQPAPVQVDGVVELTEHQWNAIVGGSSGLTPGALYYVSYTTRGTLTTTPPPNNEQLYLVVAGVALSSTEFSVQIGPPLISAISIIE